MPLILRCLAVAAAGAALAACGPPPPMDGTGARAGGSRWEQAAREAREARDAGLDAREARDARQRAQAAAAGDGDVASDTARMGAAPAAPPPPVAGTRNPLAGLPGTAAPPAVDARITGQVRAALAADRELQQLPIDVDTRAGIVTLSGPVPTLAAKARAAEVARQARDVQAVNDQLTLISS
jgi:osmotically-inducible protein OsmY